MDKRTVTGKIECHPSDSAIVIHYKNPSEEEDNYKIVRIKMSQKSNLNKMATEIVEKSKLLVSSDITRVQELLEILYSRKISESRNSLGDISLIDEYIENLYEGMQEKLVATRKILELAKIPDNMEILLKNESLMSALTRVLREDTKRSLELVTNIIFIFFCFSNFTEFHSYITSNKMGDMCCKIIDQEKARWSLWKEDQSNGDVEVNEKKYKSRLKRQDQLLFLAFHLLLNLAQDFTLEVKMVKRGIISSLMMMLERPSSDLVLCVVTFLKKLSIFEENKNEMIKDETFIQRLIDLVPNENDDLQDVTFRLILNLSHDINVRNLLIKHGFLGKLVALFENDMYSEIILSLLYQISIDDKNRNLPAFQQCIPQLVTIMLTAESTPVPVVHVAVLINLATVPSNIKLICQNNQLKYLCKRAIKTYDVTLLKLVRIISLQEDTKMQFLDHIHDLLTIITKDSNIEVIVECLGILCNIGTLDNFDFLKSIKNYEIIPFLISTLARKSSQEPTELDENDDLLLEVIVLVGTMVNDSNVVPRLLENGVPKLMVDLLLSKEEDDEMILQILYCIKRFLYDGICRVSLLSSTDLINYLINLCHDQCSSIRSLSENCLDLIMDSSPENTELIRQMKFQNFNLKWLEAVSNIEV